MKREDLKSGASYEYKYDPSYGHKYIRIIQIIGDNIEILIQFSYDNRNWNKAEFRNINWICENYFDPSETIQKPIDSPEVPKCAIPTLIRNRLEEVE